MGVDVSAYTYVGKWVENAEKYLVEKGILKEDQLDDEFEGDMEYALDQLNSPLQVQEVSYYSDEGAYVGFEVSSSDYKDFDRLIAKFKEITGDDADVETFNQWS